MSDHLDELAQAVRAIVTTSDGPPTYGEIELDKRVWDQLETLGFTTLTVPECLGGSGGDLRDGAAVVREAALSAVPIMEATFLAGPVLDLAGIAWPGGVVTAALASDVTVMGSGDSIVLDGRVSRVPWLRDAENMVLVVPSEDGAVVSVVSTASDGLRVTGGRNLAGEPRDDAALVIVRPIASAFVPALDGRTAFAAYGAVGRSVQMSGAAAQALAATSRQVRERIQFGRALVAFQAVQHQLARLASDVVTLQVASDAAVLALRDKSSFAGLLAAASKVEASSLARAIAATSHQLHGAIGFTREHRLAMATTRLWAWREEYGNEVVWQEHLANLVEAAGHDVWGVLTGGCTSEGTNDAA